MAKSEYKRLTRTRARAIFGVAVVARTSLWLGPDHLLYVETNGYTETYKRFYFRDIQSIIVRKTVESTVANIILSVLIVLTAGPGMATNVIGLKVPLFILATAFVVVLGINLLRGGTCRCYLRTAVQLEQLVSVARVRTAHKVLARIRPLIADAQGGELSPDAIAVLAQKSEPPPPAETTAPGGGEPPILPPPAP